VREYFENGKLKSEISAVGSKREGITRNYDRNGKLAGEVYYLNNQKHGWATNYYASGKVHSRIMYQEGRKHGEEIWYYENGNVFRISPYAGGKLNGVQQFYYENGRLKAEVPYKEGNPGSGLKEYTKEGKRVTGYPTIFITEINHLAMNNIYILRLSLSNRSGRVQFFNDVLVDGIYLKKNMFQMITEKGIAEYVVSVKPGGVVIDKLNFVANYKTPLGNPCIIQKRYNLAVNNGKVNQKM
jgi:antitoxin component YwqK of YwqJK toxin-antitoxin module